MSESGREQILSYIPEAVQKEVQDLFKKITPEKEFEFIFFSKRGQQMNKEKYVLLLKYMKSLAKAKKLELSPPQRTLDIGYTSQSKEEQSGKPSVDESTVYRISIDGDKDINSILERLDQIQNKNYIIFKFMLYTMAKNSNENISFMRKHRDSGDTIELNDLSMRARLSTETHLTKTLKGKKPNVSEIDKDLIPLITGQQVDLETRKNLNSRIFFRLKERTSLYMENNDDYFIRIDLTDTKTTRDIRKINSVSSNYELEIEYNIKNKKDLNKKHLDSMYTISEGLLKFIQQSSHIIGNSQVESVVKYYKEMMNIEGHLDNLVARQAVSIEIQHVTEILPNKYTVTDKADGDRCFLIIFNGRVYLINSNMIVKDTGLTLDKKLEKYNGSILDGEYVFLAKEKRHVFMAFDCIRNGSNDLRLISSFVQRLENADKIIDDCFIFKGQTGFKFKTPPPQKDEFNLDEMSKFYGTELKRFYDVLNKDIEHVREYPLIRRKYFMHVMGAKRWEIFKYSVEFWSKYTEDSTVKFPYLLDGLIYHPLEQAYITNAAESKYPEYKWKPQVKNSIDFYIEFKRHPQSGKILDVYDNSLASDKVDGTGDLGTVRNKTYRICTLYVGKKIGDSEQPIPFKENYGIPDAYLFQRDGEIRDVSGDIITDKTVVEFYYQNDPSIIPQQRWVPIKTRYDKTESVEKFGRRYGNYVTIAEKVWRSIINPVLMDDFVELAKGNTDKRNFYDIKIKDMNSKISQQLIATINKENKYYQKVSKIASTMRQFHNFIKSNLIYTYCNKMYQSNEQQSVMSIGFGRGGDIGKFYYTEVAYLVGIDIDAEGFKSPNDGAISRYNAFRKKKPNFPKMYFIQADARALFDYDSQLKVLSGMDDINKKLLKEFFPNPSESPKKSVFDRIDCQFAMHYFLKDNLSWDNFKQNLKNHLRAGGYFIATTFDARQVIKLLGSKDSYVVYYDDSDGNKKKFFEIIKKYSVTGDEDVIGTGHGIDVHMSWAFDEGTYQTEYLVDLEFVKTELLKDSDLELVDTDTFLNQYQINKHFLSNATKFESSGETREYMSNVAQFYDNNEMNKKCLEYTNLHRYFVFRKKSPTDSDFNSGRDKGKKDKKKQQGGKDKLGKLNKKKNNKKETSEEYNFSDTSKFKIPDMVNYDDDYSMINSIHKVLVSHSIFPKSVGVEDFMRDIELDSLKDYDVSTDYIKEIGKNTVINHEVIDDDTSKVVNVIDGLNIFFIERDCNNFYDITYCPKRKFVNKDRAIILMKEGGLYKPVMRKDEKGIKGIFRMDDDMINYLIKNGETMET
jgi:SAM-dependent methyltransferase